MQDSGAANEMLKNTGCEPAELHTKQDRLKRIFREWVDPIVKGLLLALVIRVFIIQAFCIPSASMEDTLAIGDYIVVNKFIYGTKLPFVSDRVLKVRDPQRGDVIVFEYPEDPSKQFIKRVVGVPGDVVEVKDKRVYVNGMLYVNAHEVHKESDMVPREANPRDFKAAVKVPAKSYFVMGDNRDRSYDSRFWGFVPSGNVNGLAFIKYWSWDSEHLRVRFKNIGKLID